MHDFEGPLEFFSNLLEHVASNRIQSGKIDRAVPDPRVGAKRPPEDDSVGADRALPGPQAPRAGICATVSD